MKFIKNNRTAKYICFLFAFDLKDQFQLFILIYGSHDILHNS